MLRSILFLINIIHTIAVPSIPPPISPNALQLQTNINTAISQKATHFTIPPANYIFSNLSLTITNAHDLQINAQDVTFVFFYGYGLYISDSTNLTIQGLTFDSNPPNYAQGIVTSITSPTVFQATFDSSYIPPNTNLPPFDTAALFKVSFYNPITKQMLHLTNYLQSSTPTVSSSSLSSSSSSLALQYNYTLKVRHPQKTGLKIGNLVTVIPRKGITWHCNNCSQVNAKHITIYAGGNMGFLETGGQGKNRYTNVTITRKRNTTHLVGLNADGFHSSDVSIGPVLEDSEISYTGDDFVNIHNRMKIICKILSNTSLAVIDPGNVIIPFKQNSKTSLY